MRSRISSRAQVVQDALRLGDQRLQARPALLHRRQAVERRRRVAVLLRQRVDGALLDLGDLRVALLLLDDAHRLGQPLAGHLADARLEAGGVRRRGRLALGLARQPAQLLLRLELAQQLGVPEAQRLEDLGLGHLLGAALHHHQRVAAAGDHQLDVALFELRLERVHHPLAVDAADAHGADRAEERRIGQVQRGGRADEGRQVRRHLPVDRQHGRRDLRLLAPAFGEQRPHRAVDEARHQHLAVREPPLALEEAAGDLAGGRGLLDEVHGERQEVDALTRLRGDAGDEHHGVAVGDDHRPRGLLGHAAGLEGHGATAHVEGHGMGLEPIGSHRSGFSSRPRDGRMPIRTAGRLRRSSGGVAGRWDAGSGMGAAGSRVRGGLMAARLRRKA
jgi:hypothetical protein